MSMNFKLPRRINSLRVKTANNGLAYSLRTLLSLVVMNL